MKPMVLVVDDSVDIQELVDIHLRQDGVDTVHASNAREALDAARRLSPCTVVLDLDLGAESGLDVCRALKRDPVTAAIPVIILTGTLDSPIRLKALAAGAIDYVGKPFSGADLRARVRTAIRLARYRQLLLEHADLDADTELQSRRALDRRLPADAVLIAMGDPQSVIDKYGLPMFDTAMRALADLARSIGGPGNAFLHERAVIAVLTKDARAVDEALGRVSLTAGGKPVELGLTARAVTLD